MTEQWYIGVDGGGTKTTVMAVKQDGGLLASCVGAGINFYASGMETARNTLRMLLEELCGQMGSEDYTAIFIGMSALDGQSPCSIVEEFCGEALDPSRTEMFSDAIAGLYGLTLGGPGVMLISGTGMIGMASDGKGAILVSGGWGYALGDEGSCFYIGQEGLRAAIRDFEGTGEPTQLTGRAHAFYHCKELRELIPLIYSRPKVNDIVAAFAREVIQADSEGDPASKEIMERTLSILTLQCEGLMQKLDTDRIPVGVYGGLFEKHPAIFQRFQNRIRARHPQTEVVFPQLPPELGAILYGLSLRRPEHWEDIQKQIVFAAEHRRRAEEGAFYA